MESLNELLGPDVRFETVPEDVVFQIMIRLAKGERLTEAENGFLTSWRSECEGNERLAARMEDRKGMARRLRGLRRPPRAKMWKEINRQLDEMEGVPKQSTAIRFNPFLLLLLVILGVCALLLISLRR